MKLGKLEFARLIGFIERTQNLNMASSYIEELDNIIDIDVPQPEAVAINVNDLDNMLALMQSGDRKIDAIRTYRALTGHGLKESKDAVEKYWPTAKDKTKDTLNDMLDVIDKTLVGQSTILSNIPALELCEVKRFVETYIK